MKKYTFRQTAKGKTTLKNRGDHKKPGNKETRFFANNGNF
jgi:hypothetical protein